MSRAERHSNDRLRAWVLRTHLSYADFAREIAATARSVGHFGLDPDRTRVGHWINEGEIPRHPLPEIIAATLSRLCGVTVTVADIGMARDHSPAPSSNGSVGDPTNRRRALTALGATLIVPFLNEPDTVAAVRASTSQLTASDLGPCDITELEQAADSYAAKYTQQPPDQLWADVAEQRDRAQLLLHHRRHTLRQGRALARVAGQLSVILAWISHDRGDLPTTYALATDAQAHGTQADAPEVNAWVQDLLATHYLYQGQPELALRAALQGKSRAPGNSPVEVRIDAQLARAYAALGDATRFTEAANRARKHGRRLPLLETGLFGVDSARIVSYDATSYNALGQPHRAAAAATEAISHYRGRGTLAPTRQSIAQLDLALAHAALGEPDASVDIGRQALTSGRPVSAVQGRARQLVQTLRTRYPDAPLVRDFAEFARAHAS